MHERTDAHTHTRVANSRAFGALCMWVFYPNEQRKTTAPKQRGTETPKPIDRIL